jgi:signal transduction histidine kinase
LSSRIALPKKRWIICAANNKQSLNRIETTAEREKVYLGCFAELRTPLTVIKGTLEVLVKPRTEEEYQWKISYCVARSRSFKSFSWTNYYYFTLREPKKQSLNIDKINLKCGCLEVISRFSHELESKKRLKLFYQRNRFFLLNGWYLTYHFSNLLSTLLNIPI